MLSGQVCQMTSNTFRKVSIYDKLEFNSIEEELTYYEEVLETLPQYPTPLVQHAIGLVKYRIEKLKEKI